MLFLAAVLSMSCRPPCGARRCIRPIASTPPSCLTGQGALAKHDADIACTALTESSVGHEASIHKLQSASTYLRVGIGPQGQIWTGCIYLYAHVGTLFRIICSRLIIFPGVCVSPTHSLASVPRFSDRCEQATQGVLPNVAPISDRGLFMY